MWRAAGDRSTDINWYSKRGPAGGVWSATVLYWLDDKSGGPRGDVGLPRPAGSPMFLTIGRRIGKVQRLGDLAEAPFRLAARLRRRTAGADR